MEADTIPSSFQEVKIIVVNNGNTEKRYQTLISNLKLEPLDGQIKMKVICAGLPIISQGPINYQLLPLGSLPNRNNGPTEMIEWGFELGDKFNSAQQYFVIFEAYQRGNINKKYTKVFTNFLVKEPEDPPPTFETAFN